jgi:predicted amidohydrolase
MVKRGGGDILSADPSDAGGKACAVGNRTVKIGMGQMLVEAARVEANLRRAREMIDRAADARCEIVVLPECMDVGWAAAEAVDLAQPVPGAVSDMLCQAARVRGIYVASGLTERAGERVYNSAVLIDPTGQIILRHRKINELDVGRAVYSLGESLGVARTALGTIGLNICADNFAESIVLAHAQARMGARLLLSPSAWAVDAGHDNAADPYGPFWLRPYQHVAKLYRMPVVGVSNVGWMTSGGWRGRKCIGCSLAVGADGGVLAQGPYGVDAEALVVVDVEVAPPVGVGTDIADALAGRGYDATCIFGG